MSYNGSGTFQINTSGQPVVAGTVISSTAFNALTADLATGLSTAITKDGQTTATARIPFAQGISSTLTTDSSSVSTGSIITAGGLGVAKAVYVGTTANVASTTDSSSISTGSIVTAGGVGVAKALFVGTTANVAGAATLGSTLTYGGVTLTNAVTGTGKMVLDTSPILVTPVLGAASATSVTVAAGSAAAPSITTTGDTNTGIFFPAADTIAFSEGGVESMRIDSSANLQFNSGYGSVATAYGCRAWVNFDGTGTPAVRASGNVTNITDNGTGDYTVNIDVDMPDANYSAVVTSSFTSGGLTNIVNVFSSASAIEAPTAGAFRFTTNKRSDGLPTDPTYLCASVFR